MSNRVLFERSFRKEIYLLNVLITLSKLYEINSIEQLTTLRYENTFLTGTTKPLIVRCLNTNTNERKDCVVKLNAAERMSPEAAARELLATFIAWEWELKIVEPILINITNQFAETLKDKPEYNNALKSIGLNYGSVYLAGPKSISVLQTLNNFEFEYAQLIFAFDVFIGNADRTVEKPNFMSDGYALIIYDHEQAFGHVRELFQTKKPWELTDKDNFWLDKMILLRKIKGKKLPEDEIKERINRINNNFWNKAFSLIPLQWHTAQLEKIKEYLSQIVDNQDSFINNLKKTVA